MSWELFRGKGRGVYQANASLSNRGIIALNAPAYELLNSPVAVELLFDRMQATIGLHPFDAKHSFRFRKQGKNNLYLISAITFCRHFDILPNTTLQFRNVKIEDGILLLSLTEAEQI